MFKNRFSLIAAVLFILIVSLAVSRPFSNAQKSVPGSVVIPVAANELSDYYQRHSEPDASSAVTVDTSDYFARHPSLRLGLPTSTYTILPPSLIDECFDVSLSEIAACRAASQSASR